MDVDDIEDAIMKMDLTDMNDLMFQTIEKIVAGKAAPVKRTTREEATEL